tara:strand:+ start:605 stop:829 length:225 start_codon:yes stop_codon:yes gene_type:complete
MKDHKAVNMMKTALLNAHREGFMQGHSCGMVCGVEGKCQIQKEYLANYNNSKTQLLINGIKPTDPRMIVEGEKE